MEPAFYRGDLLFLTNYKDEPYQAGEIVVYKIRERDIPIVHRILKVHERCVQPLNGRFLMAKQAPGFKLFCVAGFQIWNSYPCAELGCVGTSRTTAG